MIKVEITEEQVKAAVDFYEKETKWAVVGDRDAIGAESGIIGILDILGIVIEGIND